ncbi:unnamed protein product, partial [Ectocarpus sp. 13 AM-2016]
MTAAAAAAAATGRAAAAEEPTVPAHGPPAGQARSVAGAAAPPAESSGGPSRRDGGSSNSSSVVGGAQQRQHEDEEQEEKQQKARGSETTPRRPPAGVDAAGEWGATSKSNLRPIPADSSKGIGMGGGGIGARSTSALLDKLAHEQDRGQAVMMPLMNWDDWTPDRLHWTYPAVVHAFPRCLYEGASTTTTRRSRQEGTRRNRCRSDGAPAMPPVAAGEGEGAREARGRASGVLLPQGGAGKRDGPDEDTSPWGAAVIDREAEVAAAAAAAAAANPPSPFEPLSLGEVYIRTAPASDLAPVGVGAGPWRRRWLVLRQTYMFELLEPPSPPVPTLVLTSRQAGAQPQPQPQPPPLSDAVAVDDTAAFFDSRRRGGDEGGATAVEQGGGSLEDEAGRRKVRKLDQEQPQQRLPGEMGPPLPPPPPPARDEDREGNDDGGAQKYVAPVGFVCLSKASVEDGGIDWGPKTLLLRCQARPADISREEASAAAVIGGGDDDVIGGSASVRARRRVGTKICVELRVPSPEVGERWAALFRERAALEMASLFEPSPPDFEDNTKGGGSSDSGSGDHLSGGGDGGGGGGFSGGAEGGVETDTGFSVLGTGRFSRVVWARRKRPWARAGGSVSAIKIVNKQAFWSRVRVGKERVDTLAREVFCQTTLTIKGADAASGAAAGDDPSSEESSEELIASDGTGGGGIVRIHSIFETADDLILEMDLMSRTDLFDRLLERDGAFSEREAAGLTRNLLHAV